MNGQIIGHQNGQELHIQRPEDQRGQQRWQDDRRQKPTARQCGRWCNGTKPMQRPSHWPARRHNRYQQQRYPATARRHIAATFPPEAGIQPIARLGQGGGGIQHRHMFHMRGQHRTATCALPCIPHSLAKAGRRVRQTQRFFRLGRQHRLPRACNYQQVFRLILGHGQRKHRHRNNGPNSRIAHGLTHHDIGRHRMAQKGKPPIGPRQCQGGVRHAGQLVHQNLGCAGYHGNIA